MVGRGNGYSSPLVPLFWKELRLSEFVDESLDRLTLRLAAASFGAMLGRFYETTFPAIAQQAGTRSCEFYQYPVQCIDVTTSAASSPGSGTMPADKGVWLDDRQRIANFREQPIETNEYHSVDRAEGEFLWSSSPQNVDLLPQRPNLCLKHYPRPDQIDNHPTNEPAKIPHCTRSSSDSRSTAKQDKVCDRDNQNARTTADAELRAALENGNSEVPVVLAGKPECIKFVNVHRDDLLSAFGILTDKHPRLA
jgi:hypothetical protein